MGRGAARRNAPGLGLALAAVALGLFAVTLAPVGFKVVRVDPKTAVIKPFAANRGSKNGPASWLESGGLERPVDARFEPGGEALYVVDYGVLRVDGKEYKPVEKTGVLWRIAGSGAAEVDE